MASARNRPSLDRCSLSEVDRTSFVAKHCSNSSPNHLYYWPNSAWSHHAGRSVVAAMTSAVAAAVEVQERNHWSQLAYSRQVRWCSPGTVWDNELVVVVSSVETWNASVTLVEDGLCPFPVLRPTATRFHSDKVIQTNTVVDRDWHSVPAISDSSSGHLPSGTENIGEYTVLHQHYSLFDHTCHLKRS
jgi:hypothetical protein